MLSKCMQGESFIPYFSANSFFHGLAVIRTKPRSSKRRPVFDLSISEFLFVRVGDYTANLADVT